MRYKIRNMDILGDDRRNGSLRAVVKATWTTVNSTSRVAPIRKWSILVR